MQIYNVLYISIYSTDVSNVLYAFFCLALDILSKHTNLQQIIQALACRFHQRDTQCRVQQTHYLLYLNLLECIFTLYNISEPCSSLLLLYLLCKVNAPSKMLWYIYTYLYAHVPVCAHIFTTKYHWFGGFSPLPQIKERTCYARSTHAQYLLELYAIFSVHSVSDIDTNCTLTLW